MKKRIITLLAICLLVSLLAVPASAAAPDGWTGWFSGFVWPEWFYQPPEQAEPEPVEAEEFTVRYDANGGYWWSQYASPALSTTKKYTVEAGESHTIISAPIRTGHTFQGWEAPDGAVYQPGEKITPAENMTLKAIWK